MPAKPPRPDASSSLQKYLVATFERRRQKNPRYSLRGFARDLSIDPTALSRMLDGTRPIGSKSAQKILSRLPIAPSTRETLLRSLITPQDHAVPTDVDYVEITSAQLERMDEWLDSAILELARSRGLRLDASKIAGYFGVPRTQVEMRLSTLLELGLLKKTETGLRTVHHRSTARFQKDSPALRKIHVGYIARASATLTAPEGGREKPTDDANVSGITVLVSRDKLEEASRRITEFRRSLAHFLATDQGDEVFRLNIQLFPLRAPRDRLK